jgi:GT2 family glycosyltransferase/glycosyltransferase involved in cell wall biosynthesis
VRLFSYQTHLGAVVGALLRHPTRREKRRSFIEMHSPGPSRIVTNALALLRHPLSRDKRRNWRHKRRTFDRTGKSPLAELAHFAANSAPVRAQRIRSLREVLRDVAAGQDQRILGYYERYGLPSDGSAGITKIPSPDEIRSWAAEMAALAAARPKAEPAVSIIVPVHNHLHHTMACVHALLELGTNIPFEIIVADDASTDDTQAAFRHPISGLLYLRGETNRGFIGNCNAAADSAEGRYVLFLNNDTIVLPGWLDELVETIEREDNIGLIGSKFLSGNGQVQEAGGIIWRDGSVWNYGRGVDPLHSDTSYMRDVDYVSGASIMLTRTLWEDLGGFDTYYDIAYGEDSDLAFRVRAAGKRVVMQPMSMLLHFEGVSSGMDVTKGVKAHQVSNAKKLYDRWKKTLIGHRPNGQDVLLERDRNAKKRILFIDAVTPSPDEDAGSLTCFELMRAFQQNEFKVTFMPQSNLLFMPKQTRALQRAGIEAIYHPFVSSHLDFLAKRGSEFDAVFIFRGGVAFELLEAVYHYAPQAKIIFHVSDLHFVRETRKVALNGPSAHEGKNVRRTKAHEMYAMHGSHLTIVHSQYEADLLAEYAPDVRVYVFPWIFNPRPPVAKFDERSGVGFLAGYNHAPNVDAVHYFVEEIWPKVMARRQDIPFRIYGSHVPPSIRALDGRNNVEVIGYVEDLEDCFGALRLSVAPLRYGAGIKGKVAASLGHGVPVVGTACAAEGMSLVHGKNILIADDTQEIADNLIRLYDDQDLWESLSRSGLDYVENMYSARRGIERVAEIAQLIAVEDAPKLHGLAS